MVNRFIWIVRNLFLAALGWMLLVRIIRRFYKFPMPEFLASLIDNPVRRRFQPPETMPLRHGLRHGMRVLEVGPGNGRYTVEAARWVGENGRIVAVDIEPKMIERLAERVRREGLHNVEGRVANVHTLPFEDASFDAVTLITVLGEIPDPARALREFNRVLVPGGTLACSEFFPDPDYPRYETTARLAAATGFQPWTRYGNWFSYTAVFMKP